MSELPRRVLVPTDFSPTASRALALASRLARRLDAEVHVLNVNILLDDPHLDEERLEQVQQLLEHGDDKRREALRDADPAEAEVRVTTHLVRGISAAETITESAKELECDLVVMGTHGRRGLRHLLLGSVAEHVVRTASVPVLTVHPDAAPDGLDIRRILVPHDFSEQSAAAVAVAGSWAEALGASLTLLHVVEPVVYPDLYAVDLQPADMMERFERRSAEALEAASAELLDGVETEVRVATGRAADTIVEIAADGPFDLVVMGTRGLSALEHLLLGSVAEQVLRTTSIPVLTVRGHDQDDQDAQDD